MDQNLRGARALTTENLQRATSIQVHHPLQYNRLHKPTSSLDIQSRSEVGSNNYGHTRGRSDAVIFQSPNRPRTAMARDSLPTSSLDMRERPTADSAAWTANMLRGTRSQEFTRQPARPIMSPEPSLEPLMENQPSSTPDRQPVHESSSSPATSELQQQMHDLKGRISSLRDKARADSMRRRSHQGLRQLNPFTDAERRNGIKSTLANQDHSPVEVSPIDPSHLPLTSRWSADSSIKRVSAIAPTRPASAFDEEDEDAIESQRTASSKSESPQIDWRPVGHIR